MEGDNGPKDKTQRVELIEQLLRDMTDDKVKGLVLAWAVDTEEKKTTQVRGGVLGDPIRVLQCLSSVKTSLDQTDFKRILPALELFRGLM